MVKALFDTNILIDYLNASLQARSELARYQHKAISIVSWMEVLIGAKAEVEAGTRAFLQGFSVIALDNPIAERAVSIRKLHRIKLPDAIIWATAEIHSMLQTPRTFPRARQAYVSPTKFELLNAKRPG